MRFKLGKPLDWEERTRIKFLWFPRIFKNTFYWLETVALIERYDPNENLWWLVGVEDVSPSM